MADRTLVSCLMVTLPGRARLPLLQRSVADFCRQTHPDRELVIVFEASADAQASALRDYVNSLGRDDIRIEPSDDGTTLGALRNHSRAVARGDVHCQWDDDDLHHPERLARQLEALRQSGAMAVCLEQVMQFLPASRTLYCLNWRKTDVQAFPGTLMSWADAPVRYVEDGETARRGEDTDLIAQFQRMDAYRTLSDAPHLYVYVSHGQNTWTDSHHRMLTERLGISRGLLLRGEAKLRDGLGPHDFGPGGVTVAGPNGPAFEIRA